MSGAIPEALRGTPESSRRVLLTEDEMFQVETYCAIRSVDGDRVGFNCFVDGYPLDVTIFLSSTANGIALRWEGDSTVSTELQRCRSPSS
jgi:hypothetical protein